MCYYSGVIMVLKLKFYVFYVRSFWVDYYVKNEKGCLSSLYKDKLFI